MPIIICKNCGVELEHDMLTCPLCGESVAASGNTRQDELNKEPEFHYDKMSQPQRKFTWEIVSLILFSGAIATFVVDFIINRFITWSELPVAISLTIFCYVSLFAFWHRNIIIQMAIGFCLSSLCLVILDALTSGIQWSIKLGMPLLFTGNLVITILLTVIRKSKTKGINLIAYAFLSAALLCICADGALSFLKTGSVHLTWSVIVAGCTFPVVFVLLVVHFRLKKGTSLEKTFHV